MLYLCMCCAIQQFSLFTNFQNILQLNILGELFGYGIHFLAFRTFTLIFVQFLCVYFLNIYIIFISMTQQFLSEEFFCLGEIKCHGVKLLKLIQSLPHQYNYMYITIFFIFGSKNLRCFYKDTFEIQVIYLVQIYHHI